MPFPTYTISADTADGAIDEAVLDKTIKDGGPYSEAFNGLSVVGDSFTVNMTEPIAADKTAIDGHVSAHAAGSALVRAKRVKNRAIDRRTEQLVRQGFTHLGETFSLSHSSQLTITHANGNRADLAVYPIVWFNKANTASISIADAAALHTFSTAAADKVLADRKSGNDLKVSVNAAVDQAALDAIVDNR